MKKGKEPKFYLEGKYTVDELYAIIDDIIIYKVWLSNHDLPTFDEWKKRRDELSVEELNKWEEKWEGA